MQPLLFNVDWLAVSVRFSTSEFHTLTEDHFAVEQGGTNVWQYRQIVFNKYAEKVATVLYSPKSKLIPANAGIIEVANEWLYHGQHPYTILEIIRQWRMFSVTGLSRVDMACDFNPTTRQWNHIKALATGKDYVAGKRSGSSFWSVVNCPLLADRYQGQRIPHQQSWGHKTTAVKWKLYYKSKELVDACGGKLFAKPYILDCWQEAGLDRKDVWRLEVSITNGNGQEFRDRPITLDEVRHNGVVIFQALYTKRFCVRRNEGHKDRTNDRQVHLLPIGYAGALRTATSKGGNSRNPAITLLRHLIDTIANEEVLCNDAVREATLNSMQQVVAAGNLDYYFRSVVGMNLPTFISDCRYRAEEIKANTPIVERRSLQDIMQRQYNDKYDDKENQAMHTI